MFRFLGGAVAALVALALAAFVAVWFGYVPARADTPPMPFEKWAAHTSLDATIAREAPAAPYPYGPVTDATLESGARAYQTNCAVCHGSGSGAESNVARGFYVKAPQFNRHDVSDDPEGETYWKIEHGIRFTAMPAFAGTLTEEQIWQIAYFLKRPHDRLPAAAARIWNAPHGD